MPILLFRVDERLIHGQVVIGWGSQLQPDRYVVVDDLLAESNWEQDLYRLGLPEHLQADFRTVEEAARDLSLWRDAPVRSVILFRNVASVLRLARKADMSGDAVNLGGLHHGPERTEVLPYLHLSGEDRAQLRELAGMDVRVSARDLPASPRIELPQLLRDG